MSRSFLVLLVNEVRTLLRARIALFWVFVFPFFFLAMMLLSYGRGSTLGSVRFEVVDLDGSDASRRYVSQLAEVLAGGDPIGGRVVPVEAAAPVAQGAVRLLLPAGFGAAVQQGQPVAVTLRGGSGSTVPLQVAGKLLKPLTLRFNAQLVNAPMPVHVETATGPAVPALDLSLYMLSGVLVMSLMTAGMNSTCIAMADLRERNTFKFMAMLPMRPALYLAAVLGARLVVVFIASFVVLFGARFIFGLTLPLDFARLANTAVVLAVGGSMLIAAGLAMGARIRTVATAAFVSNLAYLVLLFGSDLTMPLNSLSDGARGVLGQLPVSQFVGALRATLIDARPLAAVASPLLAVFAWGLGFALLARLTFYWHKT